jgi:hypothetical protein
MTLVVASAAQASRLRRDVGADSSILPDSEVDDTYIEAGESYAAGSAQEAYARVLVLQGILASSAKLTMYQANNSMERASDVFDHVTKLLEYWQGQLMVGRRAVGGGLRASKRRPRIKEYPDVWT